MDFKGLFVGQTFSKKWDIEETSLSASPRRVAVAVPLASHLLGRSAVAAHPAAGGTGQPPGRGAGTLKSKPFGNDIKSDLCNVKKDGTFRSQDFEANRWPYFCYDQVVTFNWDHAGIQCLRLYDGYDQVS